ncbi:hypothetical protein DQ384_09200 [Sphaerisporangium album]|uniref:Uncharacterized protein n=1 Tax=Sphaerisporangium album TaxID=509200 RepID=A0A367FPV2_9ACTN|nr:hypothetical protein [Sphaerisporangium album]RCG31710.1 hypothetical protein DQ384_09200 [Sphaerisporangium album]
MSADLDELRVVRPQSVPSRRWIWWCLTAIAVPILLLCAVYQIPQWIHDHQMDGLAGRFLTYPPPPETHVNEDEVDGSVGVEEGQKDLCRYRLRFAVETKLSADEVRDYYKKAKIAAVGGDGHGTLEVRVWTSSDVPPSSDTFGRRPMIVEVQDRGHGQGWDIRCT